MVAENMEWQEEARDMNVRKQRVELLLNMVKGRVGAQNVSQTPTDQQVRMVRAIELLCYANARSQEEYKEEVKFMMLLHRVLVTEAKKKASSGSPSIKNEREHGVKRPHPPPKMPPSKPASALTYRSGQTTQSSSSSVSNSPASTPMSHTSTPYFPGSQPLYNMTYTQEQKVSSGMPMGSGPYGQPHPGYMAAGNPGMDPGMAAMPPAPGSGGYSYVAVAPYEPWAIPAYGTNGGSYGGAGISGNPDYTVPGDVHAHAMHHQQQIQQQQAQGQNSGSMQQQQFAVPPMGARNLSPKEIKRRRLSQPPLHPNGGADTMAVSQPQTLDGNRRTNSEPGHIDLTPRPMQSYGEGGAWVDEMADFLSLVFDDDGGEMK